jgi:hypothetical protein
MCRGKRRHAGSQRLDRDFRRRARMGPGLAYGANCRMQRRKDLLHEGLVDKFRAQISQIG